MSTTVKKKSVVSPIVREIRKLQRELSVDLKFATDYGRGFNGGVQNFAAILIRRVRKTR